MPPHLSSAFLDLASDPVIVADADARIIFSNKAAGALLNLSDPAAQLGEYFQESVVRRILSAKSIVVAENAVCRSISGEQIWNIGAIPMHLKERGELFFIILDQTRQRRLSLSEREEALAAIAHDLKNPLGAIFGYADAMLDTAVGEGLNPKQREVISRIRSTASRSIELVRNFQHLSQLDSLAETNLTGKSELNTAVTAVLNYTWREDAERPKVTTDLSKKEIQVTIDRLLLERVIGNLFGNALKFTPPEGEIKLSTGIEGGYGCVKVANNLPLIDAGEIGKIFQRYVRGSTSRGTAGSGLGLYIVQQILVKAGGTVGATSTPENGTVFTVRIPLAKG